MTYVDFHTHTEDVELYNRIKVYAVVNCMTVEEILKWLPISKSSPYIKLSIGCHPNHPEMIEDLLPFYKEGHVIGEIGLDNCWSKAPLRAQRLAFIKSLDRAQALKKPIILHTKGMEAEIFNILKSYHMPKIIHWYSGPLDLLKSQNLDQTYFTIGPDLLLNEDRQALVKWLPLEKILVETDGIEAIEWARGEAVDESSILKTLASSLQYISQVKEVHISDLTKQMFDFYKKL